MSIGGIRSVRPATRGESTRLMEGQETVRVWDHPAVGGLGAGHGSGGAHG
jgi:hypothetical protein